MRESGVRTLCLLALSDSGKPYYDENVARQFARDGTPSFACTPAMLPTLVEGALKGADLGELAKGLNVQQA
jgi:hypothetical protein